MKSLLKFLAVVALCIFGVVSCARSDWWAADAAREKAQRIAEETPHVIREMDGCRVYAFKSGDTHYFTRCGETVTTDRSYDVRVGKQTQHKIETIVTEGNK